MAKTSVSTRFSASSAEPVWPHSRSRMLKCPFARFSADKKIAGVCAGVARYLDIDATLVRAVWLLCVLLGGTGLLAYIVLWIVMPLDPEYPMLPA